MMLQNTKRSVCFLLLMCSWYCFALSACQQNSAIKSTAKKTPNLSLATAKVHVAIGVENYPNESYALYIPKNYSIAHNYPLYLFCDPQGSGAYPVSKYQSLAERYHAIIVGSNNSKNGIDVNTCMAYLEHILTDCKSKYAVNDSSINICGFSGGAKVAGFYAFQHPEVHSLICGGAVPSFEQTPMHLPILIFAGKEDMNFTDLLQFKSAADAQASLYHVGLLEFDGKHEWPDSSTYEYAFLMNDEGDESRANALRFVQEVERKKYATVLDQLNAYEVSVQLLANKTSTQSLQKFINELSNNSNTTKLRSQKAAQINIEQGMKEYYNAVIGTKDVNWWKTEREKLNHPQSATDLSMCKRVLGFLSLAGYSYSNRYINQNDFINAQKMLDFYKAVDPQNSDQPYLSALMYAKMGDHKKAIIELNDAIDLGFTNKSKIVNEVSFQSFNNETEFKKMMQRIP